MLGPGLLNSVLSVVLGGFGLLSVVPPADDEFWEYTMEDVEMKGSNMDKSFLPLAIMDDSILNTQLFKNAFTRVINQLLNK